MLEGRGVFPSLARSLHLGELRSKLVEVNLVLGIVRLALIVLAMVFSAIPLPFTADMTETTVYSQKVEMPDICPTRSPSVVRRRKLVGSPGRAPLRMVAPTLQRF